MRNEIGVGISLLRSPGVASRWVSMTFPPYERPVGLCLVVAHSGNVTPFKEVFARPEILWRQFRRRLDTARPICTVLGYTADEVRLVLTAFEDLYRSQLPDLQLRLWADSIFAWLTHPILDPVAHEVYARMKLEDLLVPSQQVVVLLARWLGLPLETIAAATYLRELRRFFGSATSVAGDLCYWSVFHLCPLCVQEQHVLLRDHFLFGMSSCLHHQIRLIACCACGALLKPFHATTQPFTCSVCRKEWGTLLPVPAAPADLEKEHQILACYEWWLRHGDVASMKEVLLWLRDLEATSKRTHRASRLSCLSIRLARSGFLMGSSYVGSLNALVSALDEWEMLSRFSEKQNEEDVFTWKENHAEGPSSL